jgi:hypothetical protein
MPASSAKSCAHRPPLCLIIGFGKLSVYHSVVELHTKWLPAQKTPLRMPHFENDISCAEEFLKLYFNAYLLHRDDVELGHCCTENSKSGSQWDEFASHFTVVSLRRC